MLSVIAKFRFTARLAAISLLLSPFLAVAGDGGTSGGGSAKPQVSFGSENLGAILKSDKVATILGLSFGIEDVKLVRHQNSTFTYLITANTRMKSIPCVFEAEVTNSDAALIDDVHVTGMKIISGCPIQEVNTKKNPWLVISPQKAAPAAEPLRLSCSFSTGIMQSFGQIFNGRAGWSADGVTRSAPLEYIQVNGSHTLRCVVGCDSPIWTTISNDLLTGVSPIYPKGQATLYPFPTISLVPDARTQTVKIDVTSELALKNGQIAKKVESSIIEIPSGDMIAGQARAEEVFEKENDDLIKKIQASGKRIVTQNEALSNFQCQVLKKGQVSEARTAVTLAQPPAAATISFSVYDKSKGNIVGDKFGSFAEVVAMARKIDRKQLIAVIGSSTNVNLVRALRKVAPAMKAALAQNPHMTNAEAWARTAAAIGTDPSSPSGINAATLMPLIIAE